MPTTAKMYIFYADNIPIDQCMLTLNVNTELPIYPLTIKFYSNKMIQDDCHEKTTKQHYFHAVLLLMESKKK